MGNSPVKVHNENHVPREVEAEMKKLFNQTEKLTLEKMVHLMENHLNRKATEVDIQELTRFSYAQNIGSGDVLTFAQFQQIAWKLCYAQQKANSFKEKKNLLGKVEISNIMQHNPAATPRLNTSRKSGITSTETAMMSHRQHSIFELTGVTDEVLEVIRLKTYTFLQNSIINTRICISQQGKSNNPLKQMNQDRCFFDTILLQNEDAVHAFAVMDGHGVNGHEVASFVKHYLPAALRHEYAVIINDPVSTMKSAIEKTTQALRSSRINCVESGCTLVLGVLTASKLYVASIGDSIAVIGSEKDALAEETVAISLTRPHVPSSCSEAQRILSAGGVISPLPDLPNPDGDFLPEEDCGIKRVWVKGTDTPGLAMTRAIGDEVGRDAGIIDTPEISAYDIRPEDFCIILGSDGLTDYLPKQEAVDIVHRSLEDPRAAAVELVAAAAFS